MPLVSSWTTFQIRLRPREAALLVALAERERRRPQDQAAVLVAGAVEAWAEDAAAQIYDPEVEGQEIEAEA